MSFNLTMTIIAVCLTLLAIFAMLKGLRPAIIFRSLRFYSHYSPDESVKRPEETQREGSKDEQSVSTTRAGQMQESCESIPVEPTTAIDKVVS